MSKPIGVNLRKKPLHILTELSYIQPRMECLLHQKDTWHALKEAQVIDRASITSK